MNSAPQWKLRAIKAKADLEAAEQAERHRAFWAAVPKPRFVEDQPDTFVTPISYPELGVIE